MRRREPRPLVYPTRSRVRAADRVRRLGQKGCVVWFTGLSGSGKSTLAVELERRLARAGRLAFLLDGDNIRRGLNRDLGFSDADRNENIRRLAEVARLFADCGVICLTAFISPLRAARAQARRIIGAGRFLEIHVSTDLRTCEARDVKGLYARARAGRVAEFTGVTSAYEPPRRPALRLDTASLSVAEAVSRVERLLTARGMIPRAGRG